MSFKDISYLELWQSFCSAKLNHLCNFGRAFTEEQFCEINLNSDQWFRDFLPVALAAFLFACLVERNHLCDLKEGIMGNIHVKLYEIWTSGLGRDVL